MAGSASEGLFLQARIITRCGGKHQSLQRISWDTIQGASGHRKTTSVSCCAAERPRHPIACPAYRPHLHPQARVCAGSPESCCGCAAAGKHVNGGSIVSQISDEVALVFRCQASVESQGPQWHPKAQSRIRTQHSLRAPSRRDP